MYYIIYNYYVNITLSKFFIVIYIFYFFIFNVLLLVNTELFQS